MIGPGFFHGSLMVLLVAIVVAYPVLAAITHFSMQQARDKAFQVKQELDESLAEKEKIGRYLSLATESIYWEVDPLTDNILWGTGYEEFFRVARDGREGSSRHWESMVHPDDLDRVLRSFDSLLRGTESTWQCHYRLVLPQGEPKHVLDRAFVIRNASGIPRQVLGALTDVTASQISQKGREDSERRFLEVAENLQDVLYNHEPPTGKMLYVNRQYEAVWKQTRQSIYDNPQSFMDRIHPDDVDKMRKGFELQLQGFPMDIEYRLLYEDGSTRWIRDMAFPIKGPDGKVARVVGTARDVTQIKLATLALEESEQKFREVSMQLLKKQERLSAAQAAAKIGDWELDFSTWMLDGSPETFRIFGLPATDSGIRFEEYLGCAPKAERDRIRQHYPPFSTDAGSHVMQHQVLHPNGSTHHVEIRYRFVHDASGSPIKALGTCHDVTEKVLNEGRLLEIQKMEAVGLLAGGIAHDFNNMLTVILVRSEMGLSNPRVPDELKHGYQLIHDAATRSAELTRQLLTFARQQENSPVPIHIDRSLQGMNSILRSIIGEDIAFDMTIGENVSAVCIDPTQFDQMIANLCINARDAIRLRDDAIRGEISIDLEEVSRDADSRAAGVTSSAPYVRITLRDNGVGMDTKTKSHIFEPFFTTKPLGQGTGLGLAMVHGIVTQGHGYIEVESHPRKGTTFRIYFPAQLEAPVPKDAPLPAQPDLAKNTVLVVEDEALVLETALEMLQDLGYNATGTPCPLDALHRVRSAAQPYDLILTDLVMPGMNGSALIDEIEQIAPATRFVLMSGYTGNLLDGDRKEKRSLLSKPFSKATLSQALATSLG